MSTSLGNIDLSKKPQRPQIFLARPNRTIIAKLSEAYNIVNKITLGSVNELTFDVPYEIDKRHDLVRNDNVDAIRNRYLIKYVLGNAVEWYIINMTTDSMADDGDKLSVHAFSLPYELGDKLIRYFNTEVDDIDTPINCTTALTEALKDTLWTVDYVDGSFDTQFRSFKVSSKTVLDFVIEIAETFQGVLEWDTVNRKVSVRRPDLIGINRGLKMSYGKYLRTMDRKHTTDEMTTRLKVFGKDDLSIQRVNPTGSNYIEDFSYFLFPFQRDPVTKEVIQSSYYMTDGLANAILDHQELVELKRGQFDSYVQETISLNEQIADLESELFSLDVRRTTAADQQDIQFALDTINKASITYNGSAKSITYTLKANKKHAIMIYVSSTSNLTVNYDGVNQSLVAGEWKVIGRKNVAGNGLTETINISGTASDVTVKVLTVAINDTEWFKISVVGNKLTSDGAANSLLTITEAGADLSSVIAGYKVYVEKSTPNGWQYDVTEFAGNVINIDSDYDINTGAATWYVTIDDQLPAGTYSNGWQVIMIDNNQQIIDKYCLDKVEADYNAMLTQIEALQGDLADIDSSIAALQQELSIENNFTAEQIMERNQFIIEKEWVDTNYIDDQRLYEDAVTKFENIKQPQTVIDIDIVNFLEVVECQRDWDKLVLGDTITIMYDKMNVEATAKIIEVEYSFESGEIRLTIANTKDIESDEDKLIKMLYQSVSTSTTVDMNKFKWDGAVAGTSVMRKVLEGKWDAAKREIEAGVNESVTINGRGVTILDPSDPNRFLRATHGVLGITNDGGNTFKHAITAEGIVAERLYGQIIMGEQLTLGDQDGILQIQGNKVHVKDRSGNVVMKMGMYDNSTTERFGLQLLHNSHRVYLDRDFGFKIEKKNGAEWQDTVWFDVDGKLHLNDIVATGTIEASTLSATTQLKVNNIDVVSLINDAGGLKGKVKWIGGTMIVDGAIEATHIKTGTITATQIDTSTLVVGDNIAMGPNATISWSKITGTKPPIDADNTADNIDAALGTNFTVIGSTFIYTGTLTGNTIQTAETGARVVMDSTGLRGYNASGATVFSIVGGNASFKGSIDSGSTITGATIKTASSGARVELTSSGLTPYDSSNRLHGPQVSVNNEFIKFYYQGNNRGQVGQSGGAVSLSAFNDASLVLSSNSNLYIRSGLSGTVGATRFDQGEVIFTVPVTFSSTVSGGGLTATFG